MYAATRVFAYNLNARMAQRFYSLVLYPRVRDDIAEFHRLNFHLYASLKKALFKPAAFFKGILLPLCSVCVDRAMDNYFYYNIPCTPQAPTSTVS